MKVLVCGGRDFNDYAKLKEVLDREILCYDMKVTVVTGDARGADSLAHKWALENGMDYEGYPAPWEQLGKKAGIVRNKYMLEDSKPDLVIAFPGGRGTEHMVSIAKIAGVNVYEVS